MNPLRVVQEDPDLRVMMKVRDRDRASFAESLVGMVVPSARPRLRAFLTAALPTVVSHPGLFGAIDHVFGFGDTLGTRRPGSWVLRTTKNTGRLDKKGDSGLIAFAMAAGPPQERRDEVTPDTLGAILYADRDKVRTPEGDWVALVQSIARGDQRALHSLYEQTHRLVFTLAIRIVGDRETAEEVTVDVYHDVWRRAVEYDQAAGSVVGWIMNQARWRSLDQVKLRHRKKRSAYEPTAVGRPAETTPAEECEIREESRRLQLALEALTPGERLAVETAFFSEMSYPDAAVKLNQPVGTVKTRIRSGLEKLRQAMKTSSREQ
jgi:RNA polymerase sigma-70 factor (ECF subfamily)